MLLTPAEREELDRTLPERLAAFDAEMARIKAPATNSKPNLLVGSVLAVFAVLVIFVASTYICCGWTPICQRMAYAVVALWVSTLVAGVCYMIYALAMMALRVGGEPDVDDLEEPLPPVPLTAEDQWVEDYLRSEKVPGHQ